jgi:hypothetical protein
MPRTHYPSDERVHHDLYAAEQDAIRAMIDHLGAVDAAALVPAGAAA